MPDEMRSRIENVVASTYPNDWTSLRFKERLFKVEYFCYWNRYCEKVVVFLSCIEFQSLIPLLLGGVRSSGSAS